jgi:hypothetical protein
VTVFWERVEEYMSNKTSGEVRLETVDCPCSMRLDFENGARVYIVALEVTLEGQIDYEKDHITVIFDESVAREFKIGEYAHGGGA